MARSPAFQLYVSDFRQDPNTILMNTTEIGAYFLLLMECWDKNNQLPDDLQTLADIARRPLGQFRKMWDRKIKRCFRFDSKTKTYSNKRLEMEIIKQDAFSRRKSAAGKLGAANRWKDNNLNGNAMAQVSRGMAEHGTTYKKNKDLNTHNSDDWVWPMKPLIEAFPNMTVLPNAIGFIEDAVKPGDESAWASTIELYVHNHNPSTNSYLPEKTGNLLSVFKKKKAEIERAKNGTNSGNKNGKYSKRSDEDVIAESAEYYDNYPA